MKTWENAQTLPLIVSERRDGDTVELDFCPNPELFQFQGHFPEQPILPGVAQLDWAVHYAREKLGVTQDIIEVSQLKFRELLLPNEKVTLKLALQKDKGRVQFGFTGDNQTYSSGLLKLGET